MQRTHFSSYGGQGAGLAWLGVAVLAGVLAAGALSAAPAARVALQAGLVCAGGTALGAMLCGGVPALAAYNRHLLAFGAGLMLAAVAFSLLQPALELTPSYQGIVVALLIGAGLLLGLDWLVGSVWERLVGAASSAPGMLLLALTLTLHNLPEGLAIGFVSLSEAGEQALTWGIAAQNVPEGYLVGYALMRAGLARATAVAGAVASGLVEPLSAWAAVHLGLEAAALGWALALAAGAMLAALMALVMPAIAWEDSRHRRWLACLVCAGFALLVALEGWFG